MSREAGSRRFPDFPGRSPARLYVTADQLGSKRLISGGVRRGDCGEAARLPAVWKEIGKEFSLPMAIDLEEYPHLFSETYAGGMRSLPPFFRTGPICRRAAFREAWIAARNSGSFGLGRLDFDFVLDYNYLDIALGVGCLASGACHRAKKECFP